MEDKRGRPGEEDSKEDPGKKISRGVCGGSVDVLGKPSPVQSELLYA